MRAALLLAPLLIAGVRSGPASAVSGLKEENGRYNNQLPHSSKFSIAVSYGDT
jgi:hypothetical protein